MWQSLLRSVSVATLVGLLLVAGCAGSRAGWLPAAALSAMAAHGPEVSVKAYVDGGGVVRKLSLYHQQAERVPEPVRRLAQEQFPGARMRQYEVELLADGSWVHEVELETAEGRRCELSATAQGSLRYTECPLPPADLPEPVRNEVSRRVPGGDIEEAEVQTGAAGRIYEVKVRSQGRVHVLRLAPSGEVLRRSLRIHAELDVEQR
ncbi:MAG: hypothetical protein RMK29_15565 [Myxococcales bacterium]|nr:hypothetical protein [Myxococcota bacterium]MDW8283133.1 hypothetical protein [Myxococcales bacterium]